MVDGKKQYIVHFDGNKNEQQKYIPADKISGHLKKGEEQDQGEEEEKE